MVSVNYLIWRPTNTLKTWFHKHICFGELSSTFLPPSFPPSFSSSLPPHPTYLPLSLVLFLHPLYLPHLTLPFFKLSSSYFIPLPLSSSLLLFLPPSSSSCYFCVSQFPPKVWCQSPCPQLNTDVFSCPHMLHSTAVLCHTVQHRTVCCIIV